MTEKEITAIDASNMFGVLKDFPAQVEEAAYIGEQAPAFDPAPAGRHVVILGMGGSAIGGDLLRAYFAACDNPSRRIISVVRNYTVPEFIAAEDTVIASSYSGGTEETLSAFAQAARRTRNIVCITTGGELALQARAHSFPLIRLPEGFQPRCALGYSFFPTLLMLTRSNFFNGAADETRLAIKETIELLEKKSAVYSKLGKGNPALALAERLAGSVPVVYSPAETFDAVGLRWRGQFHENAKNLAFANVLPEMNHNEIEAWNYPAPQLKEFTPVFLRDEREHKRVWQRFDILKELLMQRAGGVEEVWSEGESTLTRMFSLIYLGDWTSYYLAILNGVDPTAVPDIANLKKQLARMER